MEETKQFMTTTLMAEISMELEKINDDDLLRSERHLQDPRDSDKMIYKFKSIEEGLAL